MSYEGIPFMQTGQNVHVFVRIHIYLPPPHPGCQCSLVSITTNKMLDTFSQESKVRDARNIHNCCPEHHQQVTQLHTTDSWHSTPNQPWRSYLAGTESLNHKQTHETVHVIHHSKVGKWLEEERKKERKKENLTTQARVEEFLAVGRAHNCGEVTVMLLQIWRKGPCDINDSSGVSAARISTFAPAAE